LWEPSITFKYVLTLISKKMSILKCVLLNVNILFFEQVFSIANVRENMA